MGISQKSTVAEYMSRYEGVLKTLDLLTRRARFGSKGAMSLDEKLEAQRVVKMLEEVRREMLINLHKFEDCMNWACEYEPCPTCND